jgi:class 3 adenylate cyclase
VPHVLSQVILPPRGEATLPAPEEPGRYRVFLRGGVSHKVEVRADAPARVELPAAVTGEGEVWPVAPGGIIVVRNATTQERHAKIERPTWSTQSATARELTTLPSFRRLFSTEQLRPGASLKVSRVALLFSDLTDSTKLYSDVGDAPAFKLVHDHFDVVFREVAKHHGSVVKTIGDAVMAAFRDDGDALAAGLAVLEAFEAFRREHPDRQRTRIKLGVFGGPCYVVTANNVLDYFGQTVNMAARLQALAQGGELVASSDLVDLAQAQGLLPADLVRERFLATLKGVPQPVNVARLGRLERGKTAE